MNQWEGGAPPTMTDDRPTYEVEWKIDSEEKANWYLRKLANLDAEALRISGQYNAMLNDISIERSRLQDRHQSDLEHWAKENLTKGKRNIKLLQGTINFRMVPASVCIADRNAALFHAKDQGWGQYIRIKEELDAEGYKHYFETTGEMLPGIEVTPEHESVSITFGKKE